MGTENQDPTTGPNSGSQNHPPDTQFKLFEEPLGELSDIGHDAIRDQYFTRKVTASTSKI